MRARVVDGSVHVGRVERWVVRGLAVLVVVAALITFLMTLYGKQPYPGLMMPGFGNVLGDVTTSRTMTAEITVTFADGAREQLTPKQLIPIPVSPMHALRANFSDGLDEQGRLRASAPPPRREVALHGWTRGMAPRTANARARDPRTVEWLRERLATLFPDREPTELVVRWRRVTLQVPDGTVLEVEDRKRVEVSL